MVPDFNKQLVWLHPAQRGGGLEGSLDGHRNAHLKRLLIR